ncbi:MAG: hypothetical protein DDT22_01218 [candidate division WS2 bacterium]|nr:hypothetical protein [Candidatus Lithacetigena glycinireducens]MBT9175538.1 hypothetical protein [Candidatus Lithacetigena glycinireducens]
MFAFVLIYWIATVITLILVGLGLINVMPLTLLPQVLYSLATTLLIIGF